MYKEIYIYTDGASRNNGNINVKSAWAYLLLEPINKKIICTHAKTFKDGTNNISEYRAIINALITTNKLCKEKVILYSDSLLAINQINKKWKCNKSHLLILLNEVNKLIKLFKNIKFCHVKRNNFYIQKVDFLCNQELNNFKN